MDSPHHSVDLAAIAGFARDKIAPRAMELQTLDVPPPDLWQSMASAGLFGIALPAEYGGQGGSLVGLAQVAATLAGEGGNPGIVTSWLGHQLISRLHILGHGTPAQRERYLPGLAAGELTPCLAISEPGAGAHPKRLATKAIADGNDVVLNGEKAFLTNGPIADLYLVLAVTGERDGRKSFSIFIVPAGTPGLDVTTGIAVGFLKPSPHCGLRLVDCRVPMDSMLGPEGGAFDAISLPMRQAEDGLFAASMAGSLRFILREIAVAAGDRLNSESEAELGRLAAVPEGLLALACHAMELVDKGDASAVAAIATAARDWVRDLLPRIESLLGESGEMPALAKAILGDIAGMLSIARSVQDIQARKRAQSLLQRAG